jgi:UPF0755 protein
MAGFFSKSNSSRSPVTLLSAAICLTGLLALVIASPPRNFPGGERVTIEEGELLSEIAVQLGREHVIRFPLVLRMATTMFGGADRVWAGDYIFERPMNMFHVTWRITHGAFGLVPVRVRLPEGATREEMATIFHTHLANFDTARFLELTEGREGYLFPDTYFFIPTVLADDVVRILEGTFAERMKLLTESLAASGHSLTEIITMASLVEREAYNPFDRRVISGILWKRITIDMPLQVDAPFVVLFGKASHELTRDDLATTSPYNTYVHRGLPPGPIGNPGLDAIKAALEPAQSDYFYYLSDEEGTTHYAATFEEHKENREQYLN